MWHRDRTSTVSGTAFATSAGHDAAPTAFIRLDRRRRTPDRRRATLAQCPDCYGGFGGRAAIDGGHRGADQAHIPWSGAVRRSGSASIAARSAIRPATTGAILITAAG